MTDRQKILLIAYGQSRKTSYKAHKNVHNRMDWAGEKMTILQLFPPKVKNTCPSSHWHFSLYIFTFKRKLFQCPQRQLKRATKPQNTVRRKTKQENKREKFASLCGFVSKSGFKFIHKRNVETLHKMRRELMLIMVQTTFLTVWQEFFRIKDTKRHLWVWIASLQNSAVFKLPRVLFVL